MGESSSSRQGEIQRIFLPLMAKSGEGTSTPVPDDEAVSGTTRTVSLQFLDGAVCQ
ncbi:hypothetical protein QUF63_10970 [Anaerolineales bacterium HSG25]|nr:hypothetical protein [Anaerolineales bacterium HSG25]